MAFYIKTVFQKRYFPPTFYDVLSRRNIYLKCSVLVKYSLFGMWNAKHLPNAKQAFTKCSPSSKCSLNKCLAEFILKVIFKIIFGRIFRFQFKEGEILKITQSRYTKPFVKAARGQPIPKLLFLASLSWLNSYGHSLGQRIFAIQTFKALIIDKGDRER